MPLSAAAYKTAALCLPAAVCMSAGNTNVSRMTGMILVEFALTRFTADGCIFFDICCMTGLTSTSFRCKTSTTGFGRSFCLCSFHLNIRSSAAVVCIIRTVYHITIQFCHLTYLLVLNHRCHISMYQTTWSYSVLVLLFQIYFRQHRTIPALRLKHRSGSCGTASALPKCSIRHPVLSALLA